jgi:hypothetical protein
MGRTGEKNLGIWIAACTPVSLLLIVWMFWFFSSPLEPQTSPGGETSAAISETHDEAPPVSVPFPAPERRPSSAGPKHDAARNFDVPRGAILPALMMDQGPGGDSKVPDNLLLSLEEEFFNELENAQSKGVPIAGIWEGLRSKYDEKYIALFGLDAYLEATALASEEAGEDYHSPSPLPKGR